MANPKSSKSKQFLKASHEAQLLDSVIATTYGDTLDKSQDDYYKFHDYQKFDSYETEETWETSNVVQAKKYELDDVLASFLVFLGEQVIRAIGFQINTFISFFTFPIWLMYSSFMFVVDPLRIIKWARNRIWWCFVESVTLPLKGQKSALKLVMKLCWGLFWAAYVCFLMLGLLILGFVIGAVTMRYIVEEPVKMSEPLSFDYTKTSPVALVPLMACPSVSCGVNCKETIEPEALVKPRYIPANQNLKLGVSLTLPESDYNQKLGVFQVRVDLLSTNGEVIASPRYPCMLQYRSQLIRYLETFLRSIPLLAGYSSESQTLEVQMKSFTEGIDPTSCLKVVLEQRAEYRPGTGIPELYSASLLLESELPPIKRIIWFWRKTVFVWISMAAFAMELMVLLVCCRPIIVPRARAKQSLGKRIGLRNDIALIKDIE